MVRAGARFARVTSNTTLREWGVVLLTRRCCKQVEHEGHLEVGYVICPLYPVISSLFPTTDMPAQRLLWYETDLNETKVLNL